MKPDADPCRTREFGVLWLVLLLALAPASAAADFQRAPAWPSLITDTPAAADADTESASVIDPWIPAVPALPSERHA